MFGLFDKSAKLVKAIQNGDVNSIEKLLKKGAKVNVSSEPLQKAIETGNPAIVKLILDFSVDLAEEDNTGRTAIERSLLEISHANEEIRQLVQQKAEALGLSWKGNDAEGKGVADSFDSNISDEGVYGNRITSQSLDDDLPPDGLMNTGESSDDGENGTLDTHASGISVKNYDYSTLRVSPEMKQLFDLIGAFQPMTVELETKLKPPIPDYYPAVGDVDYFLKIPRSDLKTEVLGTVALDEPSSKSTDPAVFELELQKFNKNAKTTSQVHGIPNAEKNTKQVHAWIKRVEELHKKNPHVPRDNISSSLSKKFPDIEMLMQEWNPEFEVVLSNLKLPNADLDVDLKSYIKIICSILDIPIIDNNPLHSLHVLFDLFSAFKENQHFNTQPS